MIFSSVNCKEASIFTSVSPQGHYYCLLGEKKDGIGCGSRPNFVPDKFGIPASMQANFVPDELGIPASMKANFVPDEFGM